MRQKFELKLIVVVAIVAIFCGACLTNASAAIQNDGNYEIATLVFTPRGTDKMDENYIRVNDEKLIPPFDFQNYDYNAISMNTFRPIKISVGNEVQTVRVNELSPKVYISIHVGGSVYKLFTAMHGLPEYEFKSAPNYRGDLYVTPSSMSVDVPSYAYIIDGTGKLVYYRANETPPWTMANLNKYVLKNGDVYYSVFRQFNNLTPPSYFFGEQIIMDENFKVIDRLRLLPNEGHSAYPLENHAFQMLGEGHYLITGYYHAFDERVPWKNKKIAVPVIQEIKNGQVIFEWRGSDYPELFNMCMEDCNNPNLNRYQDYLHLNSVAVDPNDENLIVSFAASSQVIKINRISGKIMWKFGGLSDDFNLSDEQFFLRQHDAQMTKDGWLVLFDNRFPNPKIKEKLTGKNVLHNLYQSRLLAFKLDEQNKKVVKFREFKLGQSVHFMGSYQPLTNGHFLVGFGSNRDIAAKELDLGNNQYMSLSFNKPYTSYKVYKYER